MYRIRYPKLYVSKLSKYISTKCNYNCSYCLMGHHFDNLDKDLTKTKRMLEYLKVDIEFPGRGEPTLSDGRLEELLEFAKEKSIDVKFECLTNGSRPQYMKDMFQKYPNLRFIRTYSQCTNLSCHNDKYLKGYFTDEEDKKIIKRILVNPDTDFSKVEYDIYDPDHQIILLYDKGVNERYEGSILQKYCKEHPEFIPTLTNLTDTVYGEVLGCYHTFMTFDGSCCHSLERNWYDDDLFRTIVEYKENAYQDSHKPINMYHCNVLENYAKLIAKDYPKFDFFKEAGEYFNKFWIEVMRLNECSGSEDRINVICEIEELIHNPIKWTKDKGMQILREDDEMTWYKKLFHANQIATDYLPNIESYSDDTLLRVPVYLDDKKVFNIIVTGYKKDLLKLFSNPKDYKLANITSTNLFRWALNKILQ